MKLLFGILILLFLGLQYKLWLSGDGFLKVRHLKLQIIQQTELNQRITAQNQILIKEIRALKEGKRALEAHARNDLNMIKPNEVFYLIVDKPNKKLVPLKANS